MAHYLTFDSFITCTVNGTVVSSGYELHDGDVIEAILEGSTGYTFRVNYSNNIDEYYNGDTVDVYDSDVYVQAPNSGGSN